MTIILSDFMIGMEIVAEHVEEPFGADEDDLNLESLCQSSSNSVADVFRNVSFEEKPVAQANRPLTASDGPPNNEWFVAAYDGLR
jgi:predicted membrane chloride channel (bestrophin family)